MNEKHANRLPGIEYLLLVACIPLLCVVLILYVPAFSGGLLYLAASGTESMAPALAAVIVIAANHRKNGLKQFLNSKYSSNINIKLCILAFVVPMTISLFAKFLSNVLLNSKSLFYLPDTNKLVIIFFALIAEELGWRGFLQERIEQEIGMIFTPLIVGIIWGFWHFHYYLIGTMDVPFYALVLGCVFESYGYFTITKLAKGNILPASIWHFSGNLFINALLLNPSDNSGNALPYLILTFLSILYVIGFVFYNISQKSAIKS